MVDVGEKARSMEGHAAVGGMGGHDDRWIVIQQNTFTNWVNEQLRQRNMSCEDLRTDLCDGVRLAALVEIVQDRKIGRIVKKPINQHQYLNNNNIALQAIADDGIKLVNIGSEDIVNGNLKLILGLIWHLILRYQIGKSKFPPKKLMLAWLQAVIPECNIKNFTTDWNDGIALSALLEYCRPGVFPHWRNLPRYEGLSNCRNAMTIAKKEFGIPMVLRPEDLSNTDLDELSGMTYLSYFMTVDSPGYKATLRDVHTLMQSEDVQNFTTDWNDGLMLYRLVESAGGKMKGSVNRDEPVATTQMAIDCAKSLGVEPVLSAEEMTDQEVEHLGIMAYAAAFREFKPTVKSSGEKVALRTDLKLVQVGKATRYKIELLDEDVPRSDIDIEITGPDGSKLGTEINWYTGSGEGTFTPIMTGQHRITVTCGGEVIKDCPVDFKVFPNRASVKLLDIEPCRVGTANKIQIDARQAGKGDVRVEARAPSGRVHHLAVEETDGLYTAEFNPTEVGDWEISVLYDGDHISGSPKKIYVYDAGNVKIYGLEGGTVGEPMHFTADTSSAGTGTFTAEIMHNGSKVPVHMLEEVNKVFKVKFTPEGAGIYKIHGFYNGIEVKGSPYTVEIVDTSAVSAYGDGLKHARVGHAAYFNVDTRSAGGGEPEVTVTAPNGDQVPAQIVQTPDGDFKAEYSSPYTGRHTVDIFFAGQRIKGSPFYVDIFDPNQLRVERTEEEAVVQKETGLNILWGEAGQADVNIKIVGPSGQNVPFTTRDTAEGVRVNYVPTEFGTYRLHVWYGGVEISGSPFTQEVRGGRLPNAYGDGLYKGEEDSPATFYVDAKGMKGDLFVQVDGPNSIAKCNVDPERDGLYAVTYVPVEVGLYDVQVKWNGMEIPGSPFHPKIVDARKVRVQGGWQSFLDANNQVRLTVNETKRITLDCSEAGPVDGQTPYGKLTAEVVGPSGRVPVDIEHTSDHHRTILFTPTMEGEYKISIWWSDVPLPRSPYHGIAHSARLPVDHTKVIMTGQGLHKARVREETEFIIDGSQAGPGHPTVTMTGVKNDVHVRVSSLGNDKYKCSYTAEYAGAYLLNVQWSNQQVKGAPYKVNVLAGSDANKVVATGSGLKSGVLHQEIKSVIDTRRAGPGELTAHCMGPSKAAYCELYDNNDGTFALCVKPQEAGKHILTVKYGGEHIAGSPFVLRVSGAPDASKVRVTGPGVEHGILATYQSRFITETRGAGAGQLTVRIRGPKGAFRVEMQRESQKDRTILCRYDPTEVGEYHIHVKWSGEHVPGSPFRVLICDTQEELNNLYREQKLYGTSTRSIRSNGPYTGHWNADI